MKISIVIPNWNGVEKLKNNLPQLLGIARFNQIEEIIVTDDASSDDSVSLLASQFPEVVIVKSPFQKNHGFSSNVNRGVKAAQGDLIALFNTDATPDKTFLKEIKPHFEDKKVFSVGLNAGGSWATAKFENGFFWHGQGKIIPPVKTHQTLWVSGGSGVFRKDLWDSMGGLDEMFDPFYEEDVDLGYRATKRGYLNLWEPNSKVTHYQEQGVISTNFSKNQISSVAERNQLLFIWKNITSKELTSKHQQALAGMLIKHPKYWRIFLSACQHLPQVMVKRAIEQKEAKLSDEEIFSILTDF